MVICNENKKDTEDVLAEIDTVCYMTKTKPFVLFELAVPI
jgi:hypothetical protein